MVQRKSKRQRLNNGPRSDVLPFTIPKVFPNEPSDAATEEDKRNWKGWCEIESEPAFFNVMLKQFGVKGIKIREIIALDEEILAALPRPVYGLIFLYKWREDDSSRQELCPPSDVWFANQLQHLKEFTNDFTPALRGDAIGDSEFLQQIHNSFARKMDMLNADLQMKNDMQASKKHPKRKSKDEQELEAGFHFIAFVPVANKLWKLDGLERLPCNLGTVSRDDWLGQVKPEIEARMINDDSELIEFAILSLIKDPLINLSEEFVSNVQSIRAIDERLDTVNPDWRLFPTTITNGSDSVMEDTIIGPDTTSDLDKDRFENTGVSEDTYKKLSSNSVTDLLDFRQSFVTAQACLSLSIMEERRCNAEDEDRAASRRHDYGPAIKTWLRFLVQRDALWTLKDSPVA